MNVLETISQYFREDPTNTQIIIANIVTAISVVIGLVSEAFKDKRITLKVATFNKINTFISAIMLHAINSVQSALVGPVRNIITLKIEDKSKRTKVFWTITLAVLQTSLYISGWRGLMTVLSLAGGLNVLISGIWCSNRGRWITSLLITLPCYAVYSYMTKNYASVGSMIIQGILHIVTLIVYRNDFDEHGNLIKKETVPTEN